jgi:2-desacetyl-2-hydroxyethyl bacteriochlorophyllide A dehydrogenase
LSAQAVWFTAPRCAELRRADVGPCDPDGIVVEAIASGISHGTEMLIFRGEGPADQKVTPSTCEGTSMGEFPIKYGYQNVGRVVEAGSDTTFKPGDLVFVRFPHQDLYTVKVDPELVYRIPSYEDPEIAVFGNLLDVALNATLDVPVRLGDVVVVFGLGVVGMFCAQLARRTAGKLIVVDPIPARRSLALRFGADLAVSPLEAVDAVNDMSEGRGADIVFEASGATSALQTAIQSAAFEGTVVVVSWYGVKPVQLVLSPEFHMRRLRMVSSQVNVIGSGLQPRWDVQRRMNVVFDLLPSLHPKELITHRIPFDNAPEAYRLIDEEPESVLAVVLNYD